MRRFVLLDMDHTISATWHRDEYLGDWDRWNEKAHEDLAIADIWFLVNALRITGHTELILFTDRRERQRQKTLDWLVKRHVYADEILMRPNEDYSPDAECKYQMALRRFGSDEGIRDNVICLLDDNQSVIEKFANLGITCLHVHARRD